MSSNRLGLNTDKTQFIWDLGTSHSILYPFDRARLLAVAAPHASDWLNALPVASCGLRLDDESIRVAIGLRLGLKICEPHECPCGAIVDKHGIHGLSCKYGPGRITRHNLLNELLCKALCSSGIPAIKEPTGLVREDGKRPDGLTLVPWSAGKSLTWDVTVADTLAQTNLPQTVHRSGAAAEAAAERKIRKYASIATKHMFVPVAFETLGPICSDGVNLIALIGEKLTSKSGDGRERRFLFQRLSGRHTARQCGRLPWYIQSRRFLTDNR